MEPSPAYVLGALDALVQAGEVSPAYAAGVADVLAKRADYTPFPDSAGQNFQEEVEAWLAGHPDAVGADGRLNISGDDAARIVDGSRHWWTGLGRRSSDYWGNRLRKWTRWASGANPMTAAMYDRELEDRRNAFRRDYVASLRQKTGIRGEIEAALQDKHVRDARRRYEDAKKTVGHTRLVRQFGRDAEWYADKFRTAPGTAAMRGGLYSPQYDKKTVAPRSGSKYDSPLIHMYGHKDRALLFSEPFRKGLGMY